MCLSPHHTDFLDTLSLPSLYPFTAPIPFAFHGIHHYFPSPAPVTFALLPTQMYCHDCNSSPCKAVLYKDGLQAEYNSLSALLAPTHKRNHLYCKFVVGEHGTLGRHVRVRVPECVIKFIRELCPEPSGTYTGHRDISSEGEEEGGNDESFEGVLPQGLGTINIFMEG